MSKSDPKFKVLQKRPSGNSDQVSTHEKCFRLAEERFSFRQGLMCASMTAGKLLTLNSLSPCDLIMQLNEPVYIGEHVKALTTLLQVLHAFVPSATKVVCTYRRTYKGDLALGI